MPTTRPRHIVTETDEIAAELDRAADRWPELQASRKQLLLQLVSEGSRALDAERAFQLRYEQRLAVIDEIAGKDTGMYPPDHLEQLRADWPD